MLIPFFVKLREARVPVTLREFLVFLEGLKVQVPQPTVDGLYYLARTALVKDEKHFDRFDRVFGEFFQGIQMAWDEFLAEIPDDWLRRQLENELTDEEKALIESLGGLDEVLKALEERLKEQQGEHHGGNKWIGTGGTSPFGSGGYNPEGVRIGNAGRRQGRAMKVWEKREYQNLDDSLELGTRNMKVALRRLRRFAREGAAEEFDLDGTIRETARNAGYLDIRMRPERRNRVKVLLLLDVGGSMDYHVRTCERLFSAAKNEFKNMEYYYFHNFVYERLWKDNRRRHAERTPTWELLRKFSADYKVIIVGDATMSTYEITHANGSVEHFNEEPGAAWLQRILNVYSSAVWLNPEPEKYWDGTPSIQLTRRLMSGRMHPLTVKGIEQAMKALA